MSNVYVVLAIVSSLLDVKVCEVYIDKDLAFKKAIELAKEVCPPHRIDWLNTNPTEEKSERLSRWIFLDTSSKAVIVTCQKIMDDTSKEFVDSTLTNNTPDTPDTPDTQDKTILQNCIDELSLPGGWFFNNKPATFEDLINEPLSLKMSLDMTEHQQWALVIARISKRPNFSTFIMGVGIVNMLEAIKQLKDRTYVGSIIKDMELNYLDSIRDDQINILTVTNTCL